MNPCWCLLSSTFNWWSTLCFPYGKTWIPWYIESGSNVLKSLTIDPRKAKISLKRASTCLRKIINNFFVENPVHILKIPNIVRTKHLRQKSTQLNQNNRYDGECFYHTHTQKNWLYSQLQCLTTKWKINIVLLSSY